MDAADSYLQRRINPRTLSTSAIDLTGTPAGISAPPSPSLDTTDTVTRRRSWGKVEAGQDPLRFETRSFDQPAVYTVNDDPFIPDDTGPYNSYSSYNDMYSSAQAGPSTASLIRKSSVGSGNSSGMLGAEDEIRLTASEHDTEQATPSSRTRRRTVRYSATPSPLKKTGSAIKSVSQNLRRISLRVVNLAGSGLERLESEDERYQDAGESDQEDLPDLSKRLPIRGRTICCLGPHSRVRLALYRALVYPCAFHPLLCLTCQH